MQLNLPKKPDFLPELPKGCIYLGQGRTKYTPTLPNTYFGNSNESGEKWSWGWDGCVFNYHYAIEFGSHEWNKWAVAVFDLPDILDGFVWIGDEVCKWGVSGFKGLMLSNRSNYWLREYKWNGGSEDHYCIDKTDPQYEKAKNHFCGVSKKLKIKQNTSKLFDDFSSRVYQKYKKTCDLLQEARDKDKAFYFKHNGFRDFDLDECFISISTQGYVCFNGPYNFLTTDEFELRDKHNAPSFTIMGDGQGPYKPEYKEDGWKFGCFLLPHGDLDQIVSTVRTTKMDPLNINIGKGVFTLDQLEELQKYRKNKL